VTAVHKYEDLHDLVDRLTPEGARELRTHALRLVDDAAEPGPQPDVDKTPLFAGVIEDAPSDLAETAEEYVAERFNHPL
jgi:hypothetical protein